MSVSIFVAVVLWMPLAAFSQAAGVPAPFPLPNVDSPITNLPPTSGPDANKPIIGTNDSSAASASAPSPAPNNSTQPIQMPSPAPAPMTPVAPAVVPGFTPLVIPSGAPIFNSPSPFGGTGVAPSSGPAKAHAVRTATVVDEILLDFSKSGSFADFMRKMSPKVLAGDDIFLAKKISLAPQLLKVKRMPVLTLEAGSFVLRSGKNETVVSALDVENGDYDVDHQKINLPSYANAGYRWRKVIEAVTTQIQTSWFSFFPVAVAAAADDNNGAPTLSNLMAFAIISRISRANSKLETQVLVDKAAYAFSDIWKKAQEYRSSACTDQMLFHLAQRMSEIRVSTLTCSKNKQTVFELPMVDETSPTNPGPPLPPDAKRSFTVDAKALQVEETIPGVAAPILFHRSNASDTSLDFGISSQAGKSLRMKGAKWKPPKDSPEDAVETGEHIRELVNIITTSDLCRHCGSFFEHAAKLIRSETDPELLQHPATTPGAPTGAPVPPNPSGAGVPGVAPPAGR